MSNPLTTELEAIASKTAAENGFDLCGIKLLTKLNSITMQLQIKRSGGGDISIEDCASFNGPMEEAIESSQLIKNAYVLEISSPGITESLMTDRDFSTFRGFPVEVLSKTEDDSTSTQEGLLHKRSEEHVHLNMKGKISRIPRKDVINVRLTTLKM